MKTSSFACSGFRRGAIRAAALIGFCSILFPLRMLSAASGGADDFRITVRSAVDQVYTRFSKEPVREHGKSYVIILMDQVKDTPLARPANQGELLRQLRVRLAARGFHDPAPGTDPEIVLTVLYGRSHLRNPYLDKTIEVGGDGAVLGTSDGSGANNFGGNVVVASVEQLIRERQTPGYADKAASASTEKLFIAVTAWKFPETTKERPKQLWRTVMLTDDPDQDLNQLSEKMLAAGAGYFDRPMDQEEVAIDSSVAEGHVRVGAPSVVPR